MIVYHVETWVDRKMMAERAADKLPHEDCVRVSAASLRELQVIRPEHVLPSNLPESHRAQDEARQEANDAAEELEQVLDEHGDVPPPIPEGYKKVSQPPPHHPTTIPNPHRCPHPHTWNSH